MRKLLKVILPPFVGFAVFFIAVRYSTLYFTLKISEMGQGNLTSFMAFYRYTLPLLFTVAVLTQLLIINPVFRSLKSKSNFDKVNGTIDLSFICFLFALGISYAISDTHDSTRHFFKLLIFMTSVQLVYWIINLSILRLLK
ncbi:MAG TPA: hypothetical protein VGN20_13315 [Mucilaginibacter sp.]|jgi:hypothetical protein